MAKQKVAILGGDQRQLVLGEVLVRAGYQVTAWGCAAEERKEGIVLCESWQEAVETADAVVLPLPASMDGVRLNCPSLGEDRMLRMTALLDGISGKLLLGGKLGEGIRSIAEQKGIFVIDYYESELLQWKNALPTAEGAIFCAMQQLPVTIDGLSAGIVGYGRIGRLLGRKLAALGAEVTVYARDPLQLTWAQLEHHRTVSLKKTPTLMIPREMRVLFNTVPYPLFTQTVLEGISKQCLLIDLASPPGGFDRQAAGKLGHHLIWATALPGKYAPESAGIFLGETVKQILEDYDAAAPSN